MKISYAAAALILAVGACLGWNDIQQLAVIRQDRDQLITEAARHGMLPDPTHPSAGLRIIKHEREDMEAGAARLAAGFIAFGKEREAWEKSGGGQADPAMQKQMSMRMTDFRERMMAMDPAQMKILIAAVRASQDLSKETRQRLVDVSVLALANDHPQAVLALVTGSDFAKDDPSGGYVVSSSLARWAKDDPQAALAWLRKNSDEHPDVITDDAKRGMLFGTAIQDPALAFKLIGELGLKDTDPVLHNIVGAAHSPEEKLATLAALRLHLTSIANQADRDAVTTGALSVMANGFFPDGFTAAERWLAAAQPTPTELAGVAAGLNFDPGKSAETGQWIEWIATALPPEKSADRIQYFVASWTYSDSLAAGQWLTTTPDGPAKQIAVRSYAETISRVEPETAAQWALTMPPGSARDATLKTIYQNWRGPNPEAAAAFAKDNGIE